MFILGPEGFGKLMRQGVDPATQSSIVWHETLGISVFVLTVLRLLWLALRPATPQFPTGLHAAATIFHHTVLKDGVLLAMLPRRNQR